MKDHFWTTISSIKGVGSKTLIRLYENFPHLSFDNVLELAKTMPQKNMQKLLTRENLNIAKERAENTIKAHEKVDIKTIPISSEWYPNYLRLIPDPPIMLYAKGNMELLKERNNIAVVGTRKPTDVGLKAAEKISVTFAEMGYSIVSGLALGIDTAGHIGALAAENGKTIAVLAGNLTKVYPAQNKALVEDILNNKGLLLSEIPIGQASNRGSFVQRDRIQSGLSLGVCPVQTPLKSGTQHTIEFSRKQKRFLFTPIPLQVDLENDAIKGNLELIEKGVFVLEDKSSYQLINNELLNYKKTLDKEHQKRFEKVVEDNETEDSSEQINLFDT